ncbi:hypothetical protein ACIHFE_18090 [Streptomyces sp. NPDC052396]|uniref:hypothetical protein n=1 Tax=Streptomyces sp. NPDC052396 TaxID=3365689 RepID=UPI0037D0CAF3
MPSDDTFPLPSAIPTVRVHGRYVGPDGHPLGGRVTFAAPALLTFPDADLFIAGPLVAELDETGRFEIRLPATDAPGMSPKDWSYTVKEDLEGIQRNRAYAAIFPKSVPEVDLADVAPSDPLTPNYVPVIGPRGPQGATGGTGPAGPQGATGATGTTGATGPQGKTGPAGERGPAGPTGDPGPQGPKGDPGAGSVSTVNGSPGPDITLRASDVGAIPSASRGAANGVASLDSTGKVPPGQLPTVSGAGVRNTWTPQALGLEAWTCDPYAVTNPALKAAKPKRVYLGGICISEPTTVNSVVMFARGWAGSSAVPGARFAVGIYDESGKRLTESGLVSSVPEAGIGSPPGSRNNHIGAVPIKLKDAVTLPPGRYWASFWMNGGTTDFYYMHVANESPSAPANFYLGAPFPRAWAVDGYNGMPPSLDPAAGEVGIDPAVMALANV